MITLNNTQRLGQPRHASHTAPGASRHGSAVAQRNAHRVASVHGVAENESPAVRRLKPLLLYEGEDDPNTISKVPMTSTRLNYNLSREFPPPAPLGKTPQADTIMGYLSNSPVLFTAPPLMTALSIGEEEALATFTFNPVLTFLSLSSQ